MSSERPVLLLVCGRSCGSIDWILPALHALRQSKEFDVKVFFTCQAIFDRLRDEYHDLTLILADLGAEMLTKSQLVSDLPLHQRLGALLRITRNELSGLSPWKAVRRIARLAPQLVAFPFSRSFSWAHRLEDSQAGEWLSMRLSDRKVAVVLHDFPEDILNYSSWFHQAKIAYHPHGTLSFERFHDDPVRIKHALQAEPLHAIPDSVVWLVGSPGEEKYYRRTGFRGPVIATGHPKFDESWSRVLRDYNLVRQTNQERSKQATSDGPSVLFMSMPSRKFADPTQYEEMLRSLFTTAAHQRWELHVKLHPHEFRKDFKRIAAAAGFIDLNWCATSVSCAAADVDFVVCFPTSAAMDAVAAGAPVIEYFNFEGQGHTTFVGANGERTSVYRMMGLVEPADCEQELVDLAKRVTTDGGYRRDVLEKQQSVLAGLAVHHGNATAQVLKVLRDFQQPAVRSSGKQLIDETREVRNASAREVA